MTPPQPNQNRPAPLALGLLALVLAAVYLRYTPGLGFYWDVYTGYAVLERVGLAGSLEFGAGQGRPVASLAMALLSLFPTHAAWLVVAVVAGNALLYRGVVRWLLPAAPWLGDLAALLYLVTPLVWMSGYQTNVFVEGPVFVGWASVALTYVALRRAGPARWAAGVVSLLLIPVYLYYYEIVLTLEFVRLLLVLEATRTPPGASRYRPLRALRLGWPWWGVLAAAGLHRFVLLDTSGWYAGYTEVPAERLGSPVGVLWDALRGVYENTVLAWPLLARSVAGAGGVDAVALVLALLAAAYAFWLGWRGAGAGGPRSRYLWVLAAGAVLALGSNGIVSVAGRVTTYNLLDTTSRFQATSQYGIIAVWLALLWLAGSFLPRLGRGLLLAAALAFAVYVGAAARMAHHQTLVDVWAARRGFLWELAALAPDVAEDVVILTDADFNAPIRQTLLDQPLFVFITGDFFYNSRAVYLLEAYRLTLQDPVIVPTSDINSRTFRLNWLVPDVTRALLVHEDANGCLHLLDPTRPIPDGLDVGHHLQTLMLLAQPNPAQFIRETPPADTRLRHKYFPPPAARACDPTAPLPPPEPPQDDPPLAVVTADTRVVIEDATGRLNVHAPATFLRNVPASAMIHVVPEAARAQYAPHTDTSAWLDPSETDALRRRLDGVGSVWVVRRADAAPLTDAAQAELLARDMLPTVLTVRPEGFLLRFTLTRYEAFDGAQPLARFGEAIELVQVDVPGAALPACTTTVVQAFWRADAPTPVPYSVTVSLLAPDGETVSRADGQLSLVPSDGWEPGAIYLDEREVTTPCDDPDAVYRVAYGVYDWRDGVRLAVAVDGEPTGTDLFTLRE